MKRLEDIPKQSPFSVPDGYFDRLPERIQARVRTPASVFERPWLRVAQLALPVLAMAAVGIFWYQQQQFQPAEAQLASIQADQLRLFLEDETLSTEELVESITWSEADLSRLEEQVYQTFAAAENDWIIVLDELGIEN